MEKHAREHKKARFLVYFIIVLVLIVSSAFLGYKIINPKLIGNEQEEKNNPITSTAPPTAVPDDAVSANVLYTMQEVSMYDEPDSDSEVRAKLKKGTPVEYLEAYDGYTKVFFSGREGFIRTKYLSAVMPSGDTYNNGTYRVNHSNGEPIFLRSGPGEEYSVIDNIPDGTVLDVTDMNEDWTSVEYNGSSGYVKTRYLEENKSSKNKSVKAKEQRLE